MLVNPDPAVGIPIPWHPRLIYPHRWIAYLDPRIAYSWIRIGYPDSLFLPLLDYRAEHNLVHIRPYSSPVHRARPENCGPGRAEIFVPVHSAALPSKKCVKILEIQSPKKVMHQNI
jgi:hypothetical protein